MVRGMEKGVCDFSMPKQVLCLFGPAVCDCVSMAACLCISVAVMAGGCPAEREKDRERELEVLEARGLVQIVICGRSVGPMTPNDRPFLSRPIDSTILPMDLAFLSAKPKKMAREKNLFETMCEYLKFWMIL